MSGSGPERRFDAMQRYGRFRRKTGLVTDGLDSALLTPSCRRRSNISVLRYSPVDQLVRAQQERLGDGQPDGFGDLKVDHQMKPRHVS